ncbi:MAG: PQQ-binding-like beta-propeller repeat protein [Rubripirellula sp.]|nr:PQQ-binding-like beta-propeller repeat protein [Rubripirellula sp.]
MSSLRISLAVALSLATFSLGHADWLRFRGPNGSGVSQESESTPSKWGPDQNIAWTVELPGSGVSSPVVVGKRVFVTCYSGYGLDRQDPGDISDLKRHLVCVDATSGKIQWQVSVDAAQPEDPYSGIGVTAHGYASHTPVSDGENVYAFFGKSGVHAFDLEGKPLWQQSVGTGSDDRRWGSSSSPILHEDFLIVTASAESRSLIALDKKTGKQLWKQKTDGVSNVWGTPILTQTGDRTDLVLGVPYEFWGMNPETGKLRWFAQAMDSDQYSSSVVEAAGVLYGIEGRSGGSVAVRGGGKGDVSESHTVWSGNDTGRFGSPLILDGRIYYFSSGVANCIRAEDGSSLFKGRLPASGGNQSGGGNRGNAGRPAGGGGGGGGTRGRGGFGGGFGFGAMDYASAVAADGKVYFLKGDGTTYVLKAGDEFELIASNQLTEESESFGGTPAISNGKLFIRSNKRLYCVSE